MDTNLAQLYLRSNDPSNASNYQTTEEILAMYDNPESIIEVLSILSTPDIVPIIRRSAAVGLKNIIQKNLDYYISDLESNGEESALNNLLQILHDERDSITSHSIISSLNPVFERLGTSWDQLTDLLSEFFDSTEYNSINIGLQLMSEFLPHAGSDFVSEHLETIDQFIQSALNSSENDILTQGIKLFSSLLQSEIPIQEFSETFFDIFKRSLEIFQDFRIQNDCDHGTTASISIAKMLNCHPLFASSSELYTLFLEILSDTSISTETMHLPTFPIKKLLKYYGEELQEFFPQSIELFLTISSLQFTDSDFTSLDGSTSIIPLFTLMTESSNDPGEFINGILQSICSSDDIAESFASLCALLGIAESSCDEVGNFCQHMVEYCYEKAKLENSALIQAVIRLFYELIKNQGDTMIDFADDISNFAFQTYEMKMDEEIIQQSLDIIRKIFDVLQIEPSFVINFLPKLTQGYQEAPMIIKPYFIQCISSSIDHCREDSELFADDILPIIFQDAQASSEGDIDNSAYCLEALGLFLAHVPEKCSEIYEDAINLILTASNEENLLLRWTGLNSLIAIIKFSDFPDEIASDITDTALNALKVNFDESNDTYADDSSYSTEDIVILGLKLLRYLLKYRPSSCKKFETGLPSFFESALSKTSRIQINAIKAYVYFIIKYNPDETNIYDILFKIITESRKKEEDLIIASFLAYRKILSLSTNQLAINYFEQFIDASLGCLAHQLPFQEESFNYDKKVTKMLVTFLETVIIEQFDYFPQEKFIQTVSDVINNIEEKEAFKILYILATFVDKGGNVNEDLALFGLNKIDLCDFNHSEEPIIFLRSLINNQPQFVEDKIDTIVPFFLEQLSSDPQPAKHYWPTITHIISTILVLMFSDTFSNEDINSDQCIELILSKLPVKGDLIEANYIYSSILKFNLKDKTGFVPEILRIFVQVLSNNREKFDQLDLDIEVVKSMIDTVNFIFENYTDSKEKVDEILNNDKMRLDHFSYNIENLLNDMNADQNE